MWKEASIPGRGENLVEGPGIQGAVKAAQVQVSSERNIRPRGPRPHLDDFSISWQEQQQPLLSQQGGQVVICEGMGSPLEM